MGIISWFINQETQVGGDWNMVFYLVNSGLIVVNNG
jgi:hypothetical protein